MSQRPLHIAMVAYANYFTDARIKNYVDTLLDAGAYVDVFALGRSVGQQHDGNLFVDTLGRKYAGSSMAGLVFAQAFFMIRAVFGLLLKSFGNSYDVIHIHNMPDILTLVGLPFKLLGAAVILDVHDTMPEAYATKFGFDLDSFPVKILVQEELLSAAVADKVITTNRMHKQVLAGHGISEQKIELIYNVGNRKIFKPQLRTENGEMLWLGYHGTIAKRLGLYLIVDALSLLKEDCPDIRFLCIGEGDDLEEMKQRAADRCVTHMIEWKPFTDVEQLPTALSNVRVGVIGNQRDTEVKRNFMLPVKMLEYAAMEIPTICPRLQIFERYFDASSAFFYDTDSAQSLAETIRSIYNNRALIKTRLEGVRKFNSLYNWDVMAERYLRIVKELAA